MVMITGGGVMVAGRFEWLVVVLRAGDVVQPPRLCGDALALCDDVRSGLIING